MPSSDNPSSPSPSQRSTFEWNTVLRRSPPLLALSLYVRSMLPSGLQPNKFTFTFLLRAAKYFPENVPILHAHLTKLCFLHDPFLRSALISVYASISRLSPAVKIFHFYPHDDVVLQTTLLSALARCGRFEEARKLFDEMPNPNPITWAALITAYSHAGREADALATFVRARLAGAAATEAGLVSVLSSAARLGALPDGERAHCNAVVAFPLTSTLGTALLTMYSKCGRVNSARRVFDEMPHRDQPAWTAMLTALAAHGNGTEALRLFGDMLRHGLAPDHVTYIGVLHACSHAGLVDEAREVFHRMRTVDGIEPRREHYGCMVDVLARAKEVEEAWEMVLSMPMEPDERVLKSLLSASCEHGFVDCAEWTAERLIRMDAGHAPAYVMLSNMYAGMGRWEDSARVRKLMRVRGVPKSPGCSAVGSTVKSQ
ncbi:putative pentatricopeptide repeat-containing protein At5g40405 [Typha angustifolia]|uniref:putative pentatricopeptide repeat-containing protein At5g40405 n=1 Tax=Typha angustifolia TaxID=59011 RepID=UPI003C30D0F2